MKKYISFLAALLMGLSAQAQTAVPVQFNECMDLMAMVWHLAGAREYNRCSVTPYNESVDAHFANAKEHKAVQLAREYYQAGSGYDAVADFASCLKISTKGDITFNNSLIRDFDNRWSGNRQQEFLIAVNSFYHDTHFHEWFDSTASIRQEALQAFSAISSMIDLPWYNRFFGKNEEADFSITLCLLAGTNNYGISRITTEGLHRLSPVISSAHFTEGKISYQFNNIFPIVIHEFCHAYCNPVIDECFDQIAVVANEVFALNKTLLASQAYTNARIMMYETYVRASVICYLQEHFDASQINVDLLIQEEEKHGFVMTRSLVNALAKGTSLVDAVKDFDVKKYQEERALAESLLVSYECNIKDGQTDVPAGNFAVAITFDRPMTPSVSIYQTQAELPQITDFSWSEDKKTFTLNCILESAKTYGFRITGDNFIAEDGAHAKESTLIFKTE